MSKLSILDAARRWLDTFDHVPASVLEKMAQADEAMLSYDSDSLRLVGGPRIVCDGCERDYEGPSTLSELRDRAKQGRGVRCPWCDLNPGDQWARGYPSHGFPVAWTTLFAPRDQLDCEWVLEHAEAVAKLGLFVFESEDYGCLLGIDGADTTSTRPSGSHSIACVAFDGTTSSDHELGRLAIAGRPSPSSGSRHVENRD